MMNTSSTSSSRVRRTIHAFVVEIVREFVDKIIVHAADKSNGRRLQEVEIIYNHIGVFDQSKVTLWKGNAV